MYKVLVIGAVTTAKHTLNQLSKYGFSIVGVLGHEPKDKLKVSGWVDLQAQTESLKVAYKGFQKINEQACVDWAKARKPDIIFAVGFSQLLSEEWLQMPTLGCVGFHPTKLPKGRGRAPLAWLTLAEKQGAANFFLMGKGADDGPIFVQECFDIAPSDDALSVEKKTEKAIYDALDKWLPQLKKGIWNPIPQDEHQASWYGLRKPEDGRIDWNSSADNIDRLVKASSKPHPGAYSYLKDSKLIIWQSEVEKTIPIKGVIGRILIKDEDRGLLVQCGIGLLWLKAIETSGELIINVGDKLGYAIEDEIFEIKKMLRRLLNE